MLYQDAHQVSQYFFTLSDFMEENLADEHVLEQSLISADSKK